MRISFVLHIAVVDTAPSKFIFVFRSIVIDNGVSGSSVAAAIHNDPLLRIIIIIFSGFSLRKTTVVFGGCTSTIYAVRTDHVFGF